MLPPQPLKPLIPEPARVKRFRCEIAKAIPKVPNDRESLQKLEDKGLSGILIDYMNWRARYVGVRPRKVIIDPEMRTQTKWAAHALAVEALFKKIESGDDLTPHLSLQAHTRGYALRAGKQGACSDDKWSDKDFLLHGMNYHHFHLGQKTEARGHVKRTGYVIFAEVTRDEFKAVGIFDHSVFEHGSPERQRLWQIHDRITFRGHAPGTMLLSGPITLSGHTLHCVHYAQHCARQVQRFESLLDSRAFVESMFAQASRETPKRTNFAWGFDHLDIGVVEKTSGQAFFFAKGWN